MTNRYKLLTRLCALVALVTFSYSSLWAQVFQVGTGTVQNTNTTYPAPYGNWYDGAQHQFLITAAELNAAGASAGNINALGFDVVAVQGTALLNFEIKIGSTAITDLTTWQAGLTSVYTAASYTEVAGVNMHYFSTPYVWDGISNIVVETCFNNDVLLYTNNAIVNQTATAFNSTIFYRADNTPNVCANTTLLSFGAPIAQRPNMYFDITGGFPCIDPPTAGVTLANLNPVCAANTLVLTLQGTSTGNGQSYQWQTSADGTNWSPVIGANNASYTTNQTSSTYYRCLVTCGASSVPSDFVYVISNPPTQCYCTAGSTTCDEYIADVQVAGITNPSACGTAGYTDYTATVIPMSIGTDYPTTIINGIDLYTADQCGIWVDWNQDGDFGDAGETMTVTGTPGVGPYTSIINPPVGTPVGQTRMRVRIMWTGTLDPCGNASFGEVEDYTIDVQPAPTCPFANTFTFSNITTTTADVDWADGATAVGYEIRWKAVTDPATVATWATPTATAVSNYSLTGLLPNTVYEVQVSVDCGNGDVSGFTFSYTFQTSCGLTVCPSGAFTENEICGTDANGGCNMATPNYEPIAVGQTVCGTAWSSAANRDTDWYTFTLTQPSTVTWSVDADFPAIIGYVDPAAGCAAPQFFNLAQNAGECSGASSVQNLAAGTWWLFVAHSTFDDAYACTSGKTKYLGTLTAVPLTVTANDECSGAITLVEDLVCNPITGDVTNSTQSLPGCAAGSTANDDVWFSFVATSTTAQVNVTGSASFDAVVQVFDACAGTSLACADATANAGAETAVVTGLTVGNTYYVRVYDYAIGVPATTTFDICVTDPGNIIIMNNNTDEFTCSSSFYDSGTLGGDYQINETYTKTIYPSSPNSLIQVVFNSFQTESGWDGLMIYNGPNTASPLIASGLAAGFGPTCPANSWYGANSPGIVTSSDVTGALTFVFTSDGSQNFSGWDATVSCISSLVPPTCATNLQPADLSTGVNPNPVLTWTVGSGTPPTGYDVYFGTSPNPPLVSANQTATSYSPGLLAFGTTYYWSVIPVNANGPATGCVEQSFTTGTNIVYCNPTSTFCDEYVANVTVGTINNSSACTTGGYQDYTSISTSVNQGLSYPITVTNGVTLYTADQCGIWADWNQDGDFADANETIAVTGTPGVGPYTANIDVPVTANLGQTRIRVRITYTGIVDPCGNTTYGETEDYTLEVLPQPFCAYPGGLSATNLTPTDAVLNWNTVPAAVNYFVRYKPVADPGTAATWVTPTTVAAPTNFLAISGLTANTQYEFQVQTDCGSTPFGFSPSSIFLTPCANTVCPANALQENEACGTDVNGGCNMATPFYTPIACGETICGNAWADGGTRDTDWFTFTLTQPSTVTWTVDADFPMVIGFVDASQGCAAPQFFNLNTTTGLCGNTFSIDNLAAGTWWAFIAPNVFNGYPCGTSNNYVASLNCVPLVTPANDDCAGAIPVLWNTTCNPTNGTVASATQSLVGCSGTANDDVWFSFVATNTTGIIEAAGSASFDAVVEVFDACGGNSIGCYDISAAGGVETGIMNGLTIGATYYVRVYDFGLGIPATTDFTLCIYDVPPAPVNDNCSGAIPVTCNTPISGSTLFATTETNAPPACGTSVQAPGVWYTVIGNGGNITADLCTGTGFDTKINVYTGDCTAPVCVGGNDDACGLQSSYTWLSTPGTLYYILVQGFGTAVGNFTLTVTLTNPTAPVISANGSTVFCNGNTVDLSSDLTDVVWNTTETTPIITVSAAGDYFAVVTDANGCTAASNIITVTTTAPAVPVITSTGSLTCEGNDVILSTTSTDALTWLPNFETSNSITITGITSGNYTVIATDANGCTSESAVEFVQINPLPVAQIAANGATTICGTGSSVDITATGGVTYLWNDNTTNTATITASAAGDYFCTVTDAIGCSAVSNTITVSLFPTPATPTVTASGALVFCDGGAVTLSSSTADAYDWGSGNTQQDLVVNTSGNYSVTTTDANGCTASSTPVTVVVNPLPLAVATVNGPSSACGTVNIDATGGGSYLWSDNTTATSTISATSSGDYFCTVTSADGCTSVSNIVTVTVFPIPQTPVITPSGSTTFCDGGSVVLSSSTADAYDWGNGNTQQDLTVNASGSYNVTITDLNGCSAVSAPVQVTVNTNPIVSISASGVTTFCNGNTVDLTSTSSTGNQWSNSGNTQTISVNASGDYYTVVTDANGCTAQSNTITITVITIPTPQISASGPLELCNGATVDLTSSSATDNNWSNGSTNQSITVAGAGTFFVTVIDPASGCSATSTSVTTTVGTGSTPYIIVGGPTIICEGESVQLFACCDTIGHVWSNGEAGNSIFATTTGLYSVTYTSPGGCTATSTPVAVIVNPLPTASFTYNAVFGGLTTFTNTSADFVTSQWNYGDGTPWSNTTDPTHTFTGDGVYNVVLTVGNNCGSVSVTQQVTIVGTGIESLADGSQFEMYPNPTSNLLNITFNGSSTKSLAVRVIDVNGQLVFNELVGQYNGQYKSTVDFSTVAKQMESVPYTVREKIEFPETGPPRMQ